MVFIEVAEDDAPEYGQQKLKENSRSTSSVTPEAASHKSGSVPVGEKDSSVPVSFGGTEMPAKESVHQTKSKQRGNLHAEGEGDGWDTASEGDEVVGEEKNASSLNENVATKSGITEDHFEDALTEEELRAKAIALANAAKSEGNNLYAAGKYSEALECYASALEDVANDPSANELRAQCYSNRAICEINLKNYSAAVKESTKALELNPNYLKALTRRAQANESLEKYEEALSDLKKALELDPSNKVVRASIIRLEPIVAKKREELKDEMIAKLKDLGNNVLGKFGMSVDDFKAVKDPNTGSYSISFGKS